MKLDLHVGHYKDETNVEKRVMTATLRSEVPGMENIHVANELNSDNALGKAIDELIQSMIELKTEEIKKNNKQLR